MFCVSFHEPDSFSHEPRLLSKCPGFLNGIYCVLENLFVHAERERETEEQKRDRFLTGFILEDPPFIYGSVDDPESGGVLSLGV